MKCDIENAVAFLCYAIVINLHRPSYRNYEQTNTTEHKAI
jgi:hypothetical protein